MRQQLARTEETVCPTADIRLVVPMIYIPQKQASQKNRTVQNGFLGTTDLLLLVGIHKSHNSNAGDRTGSGAEVTRY